MVWSAICGFQSTLLQEERLQQLQSCSLRSLFQSTLLQEERRRLHMRISQNRIFQSTLLQEERRSVMRKCSAPCSFNPRSYKRSDSSASASLPVAYIFQSTLLQEERHVGEIRLLVHIVLSIHAPTRGATMVCES